SGRTDKLGPDGPAGCQPAGSRLTGAQLPILPFLTRISLRDPRQTAILACTMNVPAIQSFEELTLPFENLPANERALLKRAYEFAYRVHDGQKRASGEAYVVHCIEVARSLTDLSLDATVVAAGLLHDVLEDTPVTLAELEEQFGEDIANL